MSLLKTAAAATVGGMGLGGAINLATGDPRDFWGSVARGGFYGGAVGVTGASMMREGGILNTMGMMAGRGLDDMGAERLGKRITDQELAVARAAEGGDANVLKAAESSLAGLRSRQASGGGVTKFFQGMTQNPTERAVGLQAEYSKNIGLGEAGVGRANRMAMRYGESNLTGTVGSVPSLKPGNFGGEFAGGPTAELIRATGQNISGRNNALMMAGIGLSGATTLSHNRSQRHKRGLNRNRGARF